MSYDCCLLVSIKEKKPTRVKICQKNVKDERESTKKISCGENIMIVDSWFLRRKKTIRVEIYQKGVTEMLIL